MALVQALPSDRRAALKTLTPVKATGAGLALAAALVCLPGATRAAAFTLGLPIDCKATRACLVQNYVDLGGGGRAQDYRCGAETYQGHNGVDIRLADMTEQRRGVNVLAAAPGTVLRLRDGSADVSFKAEGAPLAVGAECGNGVIIAHRDGWETQYCHMARGSLKVKVGQQVPRGAVLGQVGLSGMTEFPHLHLSVRRQGKVVDPFAPDLAPGRCSPIAGSDLWDDTAGQALGYRTGAVLNTGFSSTVVSMEDVESGRTPAPGAASPILVAYVRAIHLKAGDVQRLTVTAPNGEILASRVLTALDRDQAQTLSLLGLRRPRAGWASGSHRGEFQVIRKGQVVVSASFTVRL